MLHSKTVIFFIETFEKSSFSFSKSIILNVDLSICSNVFFDKSTKTFVDKFIPTGNVLFWLS